MFRFLALASAVGLAASAFSQPIELSYMPSGAVNKLGYFRAQTLTLTLERPLGITKVPPAVDADTPNKGQVKYGILRLGPAAKPTLFFLALIEDEASGRSEFFVDSNADGDLTNDSAVNWSTVRYSGPGEPLTLDRRTGHAELRIPLGDTPKEGRVMFYKLDLKDPKKQDSKDRLFYYRDYGYEGSVKLGTYPYKVFLSDEMTRGDFVGTPALPSGAKLYIDLNGNNRFDRTSEAFDLRQPFKIGDRDYSFKNVSVTGASFEIVSTTGDTPGTKVDPKPAPAAASEKPDLSPGHSAPEFTGTDLDGKALRFPQDYKGKLVLIDFWATWCKPCTNEMPSVIKAYEKFHSQGLEIIGVSLDQKEGEEKLRKYVADNKVTWRQVFDGGHWQAKLAKQYGVNSIPCPILIDGDTGRIIAAKNALRGNRLEPEIEKALKAKQSK